MYSHRRGMALIVVITTVLLILGCETGTDAPFDTETESIEALSFNNNSSVGIANQFPADIYVQLSSLRRATAPFHNIDMAIKADYDTPITPCWYHSELGAMGYHYGNLDFLFDGAVDLLKPESLLYEPGPSGHYQLVGLEYIVPLDTWTGNSPPTLLGREFELNETLELYAMHIWLWRNNPTGIFSHWNPQVSCSYAAESEDRANL